MDPDKTLEDIRKAIDCDRVKDFIDYFRNLDEWLSKGGFLPEDWGCKRQNNKPRWHLMGKKVKLMDGTIGLVTALALNGDIQIEPNDTHVVEWHDNLEVMDILP